MWSCSRRGFPSTRHRCRAWWALTPPFHPYPCAGRSSFLWHCPWGRPLSRFGTALPCGARTFLPPFPGSDHLTRSEIKEHFKMQIVKCKRQIDNLRSPILHFAFCIIEASRLSPYSPAYPLPCSLPAECIVPQPCRSWQSVPWLHAIVSGLCLFCRETGDLFDMNLGVRKQPDVRRAELHGPFQSVDSCGIFGNLRTG